MRFHISRGAAESFANTLPLLHPRGYLQVQDIFVATMDEYRQGFKGPGKLDGSVVTWVNGALLRAVGARAGYDVHFAPFRYRPGLARRRILYTTQRQTDDCDRRRDHWSVRLMNSPLLPTAVIGSYSMPEWLERAKNDYLHRRVSRHDLDEMHDAARKAAIKDQEMAGVDIVTDGELQRDNMIDYFVERLPGVQIDLGSKRFYYDFYDSVVRSKLATGPLGLSDEVRFLRRFTDRRPKVAVSGPHTLVKRIQNQLLPVGGGVRARSRAGHEPRAARAGRAPAPRDLQIDEPYYSGFPEDLPWAIRAVNAMVDGVDAHVSLHICYGNRYGKPSWEGSYRYLFPTILEARVHAAVARVRAARRRGPAAVQGVRRAVRARPRRRRRQDPRRRIARRSSPSASAGRSTIVPAERLVVNPDCGVHASAARRRVQQAERDGGGRAARAAASSGHEQSAAPTRSKAGRFCYVVELVASALKREAQVLEIGVEPGDGAARSWPAASPATPAAASARTRCASAPRCARAG